MERVLSSWKEIAAYLGKGVRTVQRWEGQLGLPVRRPDSCPGNIVFASTIDLDAWLASGKLTVSESVRESELLRERVRVLEEQNKTLQEQFNALLRRTEVGNGKLNRADVRHVDSRTRPAA